MNHKKAVGEKKQLLQLLKEEALSFGDVTLSSGVKSNYYVDCKRVTLSSKGAFLAAQVLFDMLKEESLDAVGGPIIGADPLMGALATVSYLKGKPLDTFLVRKRPKSYGAKRLVEGPLRKGSRVVLVDDVVTTGKSLLEAIDTVENEGCEIVKVIALVDRRQGAQKNFEERGFEFISAFTSEDLGAR